MKVDELISVMADSESIIIRESISNIKYFDGAIKNIPESLRYKEIDYLTHTKENMFIVVE